MLIRLIDRFVPIQAQSDARERSRARLFIGMLGVGILLTSIMSLVRLATDGWQLNTIATLFSPPLLAVIFMLYCLTGARKLLADLCVLLIILLLLHVAWLDGGLRSRVMTWLPAVPLFATFIGGTRSAAASLMITIVGLLVLYLAHAAGWVPGDTQADSLLGRAAAFSASTLFVGGVAYFYEATRQRAEQELEQLENMRREWISMVSHELRTPLTAIQSSLSLVHNKALGDVNPRVASMLDLAMRNTDRLVRLVNGVLDIERVQQGKLELEYSRQPLEQLLAEAVQTLQPAADERQVRLQIQLDGDIELRTDHDRIIQVLLNLLANAIKFTPPQSRVLVTGKTLKDRILVAVEDAGAGVDAELALRLFTPFAQAKDGDRRQTGGSGLGLSISKAIVEKHGGRIGFENLQPQGCRFYFELPLQTPEVASKGN